MAESQEMAAPADAEHAAAPAPAPAAPATPRPIGEIAPKELFADAERVEFDTLIGAKIVIDRLKFLKGVHGRFVVFAFTRPGEDKAYSTSTGGVAVVDKLEQVDDQNALPVEATVDNSKGYYDLI